MDPIALENIHNDCQLSQFYLKTLKKRKVFLEKAKRGDAGAADILMQKYHCKVWTWEELRNGQKRES
jgi:hypothetical protein